MGNAAPLEQKSEGTDQAALPDIARSTRFIVTSYLLFTVLFMPLLLGGVHPPAQTLWWLLTTVAALVLFRSPAVNLGISPYLAPLAALPVIGALHLLVAVQFPMVHPIFGTVPLAAPENAWLQIVGLTAFFLATWITVVAIAAAVVTPKQLIVLGAWGGGIVSAIALLHWFHDEGRLFGIFTPDNIFTSPRARWPFVNPNHLAHYLLLTTPCAIMLFIEGSHRFLTTAQARLQSRRRRFGTTLSGILQHESMSAVVLPLVAVSLMTVALIASVSRGAWLAAIAVSVAALILSPRRTLSSNSPQKPDNVRQLRSPDERLQDLTRRASGFLIRHLRWCALAIILLLSAIALREGGAEVVRERLEFGLVRTHSEMRQTLLSNSLPLIVEDPLGVGPGQWRTAFLARGDVKLSGLDPEYLHNDPLQLVIELGIPAGVMLCLWITWLAARFLKALRGQPTNWFFLMTPAVALTGITLASLFDFPFRIPALSGTTAIMLGLLIGLLCSRPLVDK